MNPDAIRKHAVAKRKAEQITGILAAALRKLADQLEDDSKELFNPRDGDRCVHVAARIIARYMKETGEYGVCLESMVRYAVEADSAAPIAITVSHNGE